MRNIDVLDTLQKSFRTVFKSPFLLGAFTVLILLSILMFLISIPLLIYSMFPMYLPTILLSLVMIVFSLWLSMIGIGSIILSVEKINKNKRVKFWDIFDQGIKNSFRLSIAYSLEQAFLMAGLLLFIIPGIALAVKLSLITPACILEKKGYGVKRSWDATKGNFWKIFLILIIWNAAFIIFGMLPYLFIINIVLLPVYLATLTILYIQLRKR